MCFCVFHTSRFDKKNNNFVTECAFLCCKNEKEKLREKKKKEKISLLLPPAPPRRLVRGPHPDRQRALERRCASVVPGDEESPA